MSLPMADSSVRVRYAPSPTGSPHVGNIRDALFKHLLARHFGGTMILRVEDTDRTRYVPGCEDEIIESLKWVGVDWDEGPDIGGPNGPYRQSDRKEAGIYDHWIHVLLESGGAYYAFDTPEELAEMREYQQINKQAVGYFGGTWRDAVPSRVEEARAKGLPAVVRQRIPRNETIVIQDYIRGRIEWDSNTVDDPVLIKADGMPTYHFAAMVDDHLMGITHIMRGEEWISSAPKHACLFDSFGWPRPVFVHCPVIKGRDGAKLSKRHGDTRCLDFRSAGFLPHVIANFIALIGWSPGGDREIMSEAELIEAFTLDGLQPSPGVFDLDKLKWMNGTAIRSLAVGELFERVSAFVRHPETDEYWAREAHADQTTGKNLKLMRHATDEQPGYVLHAIELEQERVQTLADFGDACAFFFVEQPPMDPTAVDKWFKTPHAGELFRHLIAEIRRHSPDLVTQLDVTVCEQMVKDFGAKLGLEKLGPVVHPTRVALTGKTVGPGLFQLMSALGAARMISRLERAIEMVGA